MVWYVVKHRNIFIFTLQLDSSCSTKNWKIVVIIK